MIAMQYKIVLPADYPMESIENRIETKGHLLNDYPGLVFKAYLYSRKDAEHYRNPVNSYAPFYVWQDHRSMMVFLASDGFKGLCEQFGRPQVNTWFVEGEVRIPSVEDTLASVSHQVGDNSDVRGVEVTNWQPLNVEWLCEAKPDVNSALYRIGYIAKGKVAL